MSEKYKILKDYYGHKSFREGQEEIIDALLKKQDVLAVMPTGAGKSVCYQIPAMLFAGITLVISPLISLMKDQVSALIQMGIPAAYINSSLEPHQVTKALEYARDGKYKIIYVAPERLETWEFKKFCYNAKISLVAIDEAHCVSQWGPDFRPSYLKIAEFISSFQVRPVVGAFTATATKAVKDDILTLLNLKTPLCLTTGFDRPNLKFSVSEPANKSTMLLQLVKERRDKSGIIYCSTRKTVEEVCDLLTYEDYPATRYHAGLSDDERKRNQDDFVFDRKPIMVATNAFGMGIDKSNVSFVIHYNMPKDIESYYQEAGRAGRDGSEAECILLYNAKDIRTIKFFINNPNENEELTEEQIEINKERELERLQKMIGYCQTRDCLRSYILNYFGDTSANYCGNCSNCLTNFETVDATVDAQKIMSCVARTEEKYGRRMIADILRGSETLKVQNAELQKQSTFGIMNGYTKQEVYDIIDGLVSLGFMEFTLGEYPVLKLLPPSKNVLFKGEKVMLKIRKKPKKEKKTDKLNKLDTDLFTVLKLTRRKLAIKTSMPDFVILSDATLIEMARNKPTTEEEFLAISGVGKVKYERYGQIFMDVIKERITDHE